MKNKAIRVLSGVVLCILAAGVIASVTIIRSEGIEGIWHRKKAFINRVRPDAAPLVQGAEDKAREAFGSSADSPK